MHAVHPSPDAHSFTEPTGHRQDFVETPAMRMRWFYDMVDAEERTPPTPPAPEPERIRASTFERMVQQHSRASPTLLYPMSSSPPPLADARGARHRSTSWPDTPMDDAADASGARAPAGAAGAPTHDIPPEPRTLRFGPDHRLVSYAASEAPPRADFTRKRRRKE
ncbi:hypothetical protein MOBT1_001103 [Malassezia obtusa]|uniref:Uncharacterized protein n=1 Tax=Malassezia obtusa TaxID=76774 RepID=A0AAF0IVU9_9BASI|nr:hypothetical protein MOBT1_001103 [Malassezia obtusa]